jgi:hypothetical protein
MRARQWTEHQNENREDRAGGECIAEERQCDVSACKALRHDPGANHGGEQERRAQPLAEDALRQRRHQFGSVALASASVRPISCSRRCSVS